MPLEQRKTPHVLVTLESALAKWDMLVTNVTLVIRDISNNQMEFAKVKISSTTFQSIFCSIIISRL